MVKVLHAADFHLDSAFGALSEERSRQRRQECRTLAARLVDYGNDHGAQLMLLSGDLFDGERIYGETARELAAALGRFRGQVVIAPGNHDPYTSRSPYARTLWPENVHIFRENTIGSVTFPQYDCTVYGAAFTASEMGAPEGFTATAAGLRLLVLHGEVGATDSRYRPVSTQWLQHSDIHYAAMGHVHRYSGLQMAGETAWAYPGCPEGRGFDELGEKGFLFGEVSEEGASMQFVPFARRRYERMEVDITGGEAYEKSARALQGRSDDICRLVLTGSVEAPIDSEALREKLRPLCWELELRDETQIERDLWSGCGDDSLRGLFLENLRRRYDAAPPEERATIERAARFGLAAMEDRDI